MIRERFRIPDAVPDIVIQVFDVISEVRKVGVVRFEQ
jgi:hypothetical protein